MKLIHTWTYRDAEKRVLGLVKRFETTDEKGATKKLVVPYFLPDEEGNWKKGGGKKPRALFNLPGITNSKSIVVVEGEKCAEALMQLGVPATTSCGGAHGVKEADWSPFAKTEKVYLLPDADGPGEVYIEQVAQQIYLANPKAKFFALRIEGVDGEDIVDWMRWHMPATIPWDGYEELSDTSRMALKDLLKEFFEQAVPFHPVLLDEYDERSKNKNRGDDKSHTGAVRAALTFRDILAKYGKTSEGQKRDNGCVRVSSPFSSDSNPSFDYNEEEKWFHCFSSGASGDVFKLIAQFENCGTKGSDWKKVFEIAESITGLTRNKQERKSKVTSISTRLPLDTSSIAHQLLSIPNDNLSPEDAYLACEPVLRAMAASDGAQDEFVFGHIKDHFKLKANFMKPFRQTVREMRAELKENGKIENETFDEKPTDAPRELYLTLFPKFLGEIRKDIFSGDALYWDEKEKVYSPVLNQMKYLKSQFLEYGERKNIRFFMSAVDYHFEEYASKLEPRLVVDVPEWDGKDYLKELVKRVTLEDVDFGELGKIDNAVLEEFIKEWHSKMWEKLANPRVQNRIIVLKGDQGIGKDFWQEEQLGGLGQFMVPMTVEDSNKDTKAQLHQGLAVTISEFDRTVKQHTSTMKELLTAATTMIRLPYDARAKPRYVRCSFMASCNVDEVLRDYTGNRRYVLFALKDIDRSDCFSEAEKLQVLAQGKFLAQQKFRVTARSEQLMAAYIDQETPESPTELLLEEWDDIAHQFYNSKLDFDQKRETTEQATRGDAPKDAFGFMPNKFMIEDRVLERLGKKFGWNERYVTALLKKSGRRARLRIGSTIERGFYWLQKDAPIVTDVSGGVTDDEVDFL